MSSAAALKQQYAAIFNAYASEGLAKFTQEHADAAAPVLSHVCFKFSSQEAYEQYVESAREIGTVTSEQFNGKEITWVKLNEPVVKDGQKLEWLELVEPRAEKNPFDGPTYVGYAVPGLAGAVKLPSNDGATYFRYQSLHATQMAPKK